MKKAKQEQKIEVAIKARQEQIEQEKVTRKPISIAGAGGDSHEEKGMAMRLRRWHPARGCNMVARLKRMKPKRRADLKRRKLSLFFKAEG